MTFKPGQSGNPSGRPKENNEVKELARKWTAKAIQRLGEILMAPDDPRASAAAATVLLDRGWGKPHQTSEIAITHRMAETLSDDELASIATRGGADAAQTPADTPVVH